MYVTDVWFLDNNLFVIPGGNGDVPYGSLKLANSSGSSGVLLVYDETFLPLCDSGFSMAEATVVCRQLGHSPYGENTQPSCMYSITYIHCYIKTKIYMLYSYFLPQFRCDRLFYVFGA